MSLEDMKIAIDTSIFCADYRMAGSGFCVFLQGIRRIGASCCIPEVVFDELLAKYGQKLHEIANSARQVNQSWRQLAGKAVIAALETTDVETAVDQYRQFLRDRFRDEGFSLLPYPEVPHRALVNRAVNRKRPFRDSGSGYRDALIWASIVSLARSEKNVVFITANSSDFGTSPTLHADLQADLETGTSIDLFNALAEFNAARVIPNLQHLDSVLDEIQEDRFTGFSLRDWIMRSLTDTINDADFGDIFAGLEQDQGSAHISQVRQVRKITVDDVRRLPSEGLLVSANADVTLEISVSTDKEDYWFDYDFNVAFTLTIEDRSFKVTSSALDEIGDPCDVKINPQPRRNS